MKKKRNTLLGILLTLLLSLTGCSGADVSDEVVLKIGGQEILRSEYMVYLYTTSQGFVTMAGEDVWSMDFDGQTADELVEERTISTIRSVIAAKGYAEENGIALTEEQKTEAHQAAEQFLQNTSAEDLAKMGIDPEGLQMLMEDSYLYALVHQSIAAECAVDEGDLEVYYQENRELLQEEYTVLTVQSILLDDEERAEEAAERANSGEDFGSLFAEYDVEPDEENGGVMYLKQQELQTTFGLTEPTESGDIIGPLQMGEGWFLLRIAEKTVPSETEVRELAEKIYRSEIQNAYTEARFAELMEAQSVEKTDGVWDTLEKFH